MKTNIFCRLTAMLLLLVLALTLVSCGEDETPDEGTQTVSYTLTYQGTKITLGEVADNVLAALGTYQSKTEIGDCGGLGAQVKYVYTDLTLYVLEGKNGNTVDQISINNDLISTNEGISIGDDKAKVTEAYGTPTAQTSKKMEYQNGNKYLVFDLAEDGTVSAIVWKIVNQ